MADSQQLVYRFIDASVPPEYHRSYTITVTPGEVNFTVDCYGDLLAEYTLPLSDKSFKQFLTALQRTDIFAKEPIDHDACAGGKTDKFDIVFDNISIKGYVYHCANKRYGNLGGNTDEVARLFKDLIPGFKGKLRT